MNHFTVVAHPGQNLTAEAAAGHYNNLGYPVSTMVVEYPDGRPDETWRSTRDCERRHQETP